MINTEEELNVSYGSLSMEKSTVTLYGRRWYLLFLYFLLGFVGAFGASYTGTVDHAMILAFNWSKLEITLMGMWPPILFILTFGSTIWLLDTKGLRPSMLVASGFLTAGFAVQCITSTPPYASWTFNLALIFMSVAMPLIMGGQALFACVWFPPQQRTLAIACAAIGNYLGFGTSSIIGPIAVPIINKRATPASIILNSTSNISMIDSIGASPDVLRIRHDMMIYVYIQFGVALAVSLAVLIYFPNKPPTPPSVSASVTRMSFKNGAKAMVRQPMFWIVTALFSVTNAINGVYSSLLDLILIQSKISGDQTKTGQMQLGSTIGGVLLSFIIASLVDRFKAFAKHILTICIIIAAGSMLWFSYLIHFVEQPSTGLLYASFILGSSVLYSLTPIYFELACDVTYPVGEGITAGALNVASNAMTGIFLLIQIAPNIGAQTINWICFGAMVLCIPLSVLFKPAQPRT